MPKKIKLISDANGVGVQEVFHPEASQNINIGVASALSTDLTGVEIVRLVATGNCHVKFGNSTITAGATDMYVPTDTPEYFSLGGDTYIAVIQDAAALGLLFITPMD
jgi:hypothetical protein